MGLHWLFKLPRVQNTGEFERDERGRTTKAVADAGDCPECVPSCKCARGVLGLCGLLYISCM